MTSDRLTKLPTTCLLEVKQSHPPHPSHTITMISLVHPLTRQPTPIKHHSHISPLRLVTILLLLPILAYMISFSITIN